MPLILRGESEDFEEPLRIYCDMVIGIAAKVSVCISVSRTLPKDAAVKLSPT
jgi:hypothetical protein